MKNKKQNFDSENIFAIIQDLPNQLIDSFASTKIKIKSPKIFVGAMGGSAFPVDLLTTLFTEWNACENLKITIARDYQLPKEIDSSYSGIFISYSGNTEETLALLKQAQKKKLQDLILISHGGEIAKIAKDKGYSYLNIPDYQQPRFSFGYILGSLAKILCNSKMLDLPENKITKSLEKIKKDFASVDVISQELASQLKNRLPLIYTTEKWRHVAKVIKIFFNENAKIPAFYNVFPEMNHNEMVGFENPGAEFAALLLNDPADYPQNQKRMSIFSQITKNKIKNILIQMSGNDDFEKMFNILELGLLTAYHHAINRQINPAPVKMVENFKELMK